MRGYKEYTEEMTRETFGDDTTFTVDVVRGWFPDDMDGHHATVIVRMCKGGSMRARLILSQEDLDTHLIEDHWYEAAAIAADETDGAFWDDFLGYTLENWEALAAGPVWACEGDRTLNEAIFD
jgi:hypothetical protein